MSRRVFDAARPTSIGGVTFYPVGEVQADGETVIELQDFAYCPEHRVTVDVGAELRAHLALHQQRRCGLDEGE